MIDNPNRTIPQFPALLAGRDFTPSIHFIYHHVDLPYVPIIAEMQETGCLIDTTRLLGVQEKIDQRLAEIEAMLAILNRGTPFNPRAPEQVKAFFYDRLKLPPLVQRKRGKEIVEYGTDVDHLERLKAFHGTAPHLIQEHRLLTKRKGTYIQAILDNVKPGPHGPTLYSTFFNTVVNTGRLSSGDPVNLQSIPKRAKPGQPDFVVWTTKEIRKCFVAPPGWVVCGYDQASAEFRIMIVLGEDHETIRAIIDGLDIHLAGTVALLNSKGIRISLEEAARLRKEGGKVRVSPNSDALFPIDALRDAVKNGIYGLAYGQTEVGQLEYMQANNLPFGIDDCRALRDIILTQRPGMKRVIDRTTAFVLAHGYTDTYFGRRMWWPDALDPVEYKRSEGVRSGVNSVMQGTNADIKKIADRRIWEVMREWRMRTRQILAVHDESRFLCPEDEHDDLKAIIEEVGPAVTDWPLRIEVDFGSGPSWGENS